MRAAPPLRDPPLIVIDPLPAVHPIARPWTIADGTIDRMTGTPRPVVVLIERAVLIAWSVVEALAEVTVTVVAVREARRRVRPSSTPPVDQGDAAAGEQTWSAPCAALTTSLAVDAPLRL